MSRPYVCKSIGVGWKAQKLSVVKDECDGQVCDYVVMVYVVLVLLRNKNFGEIRFLDIYQTQKECEYGARLTDRTKERMKKLGSAFLLTWAEYDAAPYCKKHIFNEEITLPFAKWQRNIKDYNNMTLIGCIKHWKVDSLNIPMIFKAQEIALVDASKVFTARYSEWGGGIVE